MEVVLAASSADADVGCWDLKSGAEKLRYKTCASTPHGLVCVGSRFLVSSQIRDSKANTGLVLYWSWTKPQVEVKSFPSESIGPLASNHPGTYLAGGGLSGEIYFWEVETGRLLKKWYAHNGAVTCLVFSEDDSLLISASEDGCVRVWSLFMIFDDWRRHEAGHRYVHSFLEHTVRVTDIIIGNGGCNAIIISAAEDCTCKVWSLSRGTLLRNIVFPSIINAIALDPAEHVFYAGSGDGKIFIVALNTDRISSSNHEMNIIGSFSNHSKAVTCLTYSAREYLLISGSEDGMVRLWNAKTRNLVRMFKHSKEPINNILVAKRHDLSKLLQISRKQGSLLPPPLEKYSNSTISDDSNVKTIVSLPNGRSEPINNILVAKRHDLSKLSRKQKSLLPPPLEKYSNSTISDDSNVKTIVSLPNGRSGVDVSYISSQAIFHQIKEFQNRGSSASEMEMERLKADCKRSVLMVDRYKKMYEDLQEFYEDDFLKSGQTKTLDETGS